ncbi:MAG: electron transfer flavoprotein-ubiquinone oxidoreductase [Rhodospirillaceae bacterium]|nr:electron transfer flavoprotein-ubiquinone oxidoreductase [Rhodospirillaceae bacterium]|tara:strand:- start:2920 stop:4551 length:1632 start_codon:yes stop_codon:yes gene_type:complete
MQRESMEVDVVILGGGPSGLSAAIRLRQLAEKTNQEISVCVLEKGSEVGAHILSGAVLEPRALNELFPNWKELGAPLNTPVTEDQFLLLSEKNAISLPTPPQMNNHGNYIVSLGNVCRWLKEQAEALEVQIFEGFAGAEILFNDDGNVSGVATGDMGINREGEQKDGFTPGYELHARYTLFAEGCRGSLTGKLFEKFDMRRGHDPQTYAIGLKELWEVDPEKHHVGRVTHTIGWPLDHETYGGSFIYHLENNQVAVGYVIGLDYKNPHLSPFDEFQRFKKHPKICSLFEGGRRVSYGARALNEGGFQSIPDLVCPGGAIIGCAAGFVNVPKIKGSHTAMKTGMLAAESVFEALNGKEASPIILESYPKQLKQSWVWEELYRVRNVRPYFRWGLWIGLVLSAIDTYLFRGRAPWTLNHHNDHDSLLPAKNAPKIKYPKPDGKISFDKLSSVFIANTNHEEDQPCHLTLKDPEVPISVNFEKYDSPEQRYCPAGVYEIVEVEEKPRLQINAQNCVHCKTCDIKDPTQNIRWITPEGGGGPNYPNM